jgi:branched-chain amino acid transport system ATP-binding protein
MKGMPLLKVENLVVNYGSINALKGISFEVNKGEIVTLIGSNGAGKSTTMNTIAGLKSPSGGKIYFEDNDITKLDSSKRVKAGIILSPEGRQVFPEFSVYDNLMMGGFIQKKKDNLVEIEKVFELFPVLKERKKQMAGTLSGGEQQMLAVARALMGKPKLLMLDEPSMGLAPLIVKEIFGLIQRIREIGTTVLLVEQNARVALKISDRAYVIETGKIVLSGKAQELLESEDVQKAYLGM